MSDPDLTKRLMRRTSMTPLVQIIEVNPSATPYPVAHGVSSNSATYTIDLTVAPAGIRNLPQVGEHWWIDSRSGHWVLHAKQLGAIDNGLSLFGDMQPIVRTLNDGSTATWGSLTGCVVKSDESILYFCDASNLYSMGISWTGGNNYTFSYSTVATGLTTACKPGLSSDGYVYVCETSLNQILQVNPSTGTSVVACTLPVGPVACDINDTLSTGEGIVAIGNNGDSYKYVGAPGGAAALSGSSGSTDVVVNATGWTETSGICIVAYPAFNTIGNADYSTATGHVGAVTVYNGRRYGEPTGPATKMIDGDYQTATFVAVGDCAVSKGIPRHVFVVGDGPSRKAIRWMTVNMFDYMDPVSGLMPSGNIYAVASSGSVWRYKVAFAASADSSQGMQLVANLSASQNILSSTVGSTGDSYLLYYDPVSHTLNVARITSAGVVTEPWVTIPGVPTQLSSNFFESIGYGRDGNLYVVSPATGHQQVHQITLSGTATEQTFFRSASSNYRVDVSPAVTVPLGHGPTLWLAAKTDPDHPTPGQNSVLYKCNLSTGTIEDVVLEPLANPASSRTDIQGGLLADQSGDVFVVMSSGWVDEVLATGSVRRVPPGDPFNGISQVFLDDDGSTLWTIDGSGNSVWSNLLYRITPGATS